MVLVSMEYAFEYINSLFNMYDFYDINRAVDDMKFGNMV